LTKAGTLTPAPEDTIGYIWQYMHTNMTDEQMRLVKRFQTVEEEVGQQKG